MRTLKYKYTRFFVVAVLAALSVTAFVSYPAQALDPRCDPEVYDIQQTHADAKRVEAQAIAAELTPQNDTVHAMTCFDQQLAMSARAGEIFSDTTPASFTPVSIIGIGLGAIGLSGLDPGARDSSLLADFSSVISGVLSDLLADFTGAITGFISDAIGPALGGFLGGFLGGALAAIFGGLSGHTYDCENMTDTWQNNIIGQGVNVLTNSIPSIDELLNFGAPPPGGWPAAYDTKFNLPANAAILNKAFNDKNVRMQPGGMAVYKTAPALGLNTNLAAVLGAM